jgi:Spy/CpxP family protein refolding chaperone
MMPRSWRFWLALLLVFAAGAVTGATLTHLRFKQAFNKGFRQDWTEGAMGVLEKRLALTPEQQPKVRAIVEDTGLQLKTHFSKTMNESGEIMAQSYRRVDQELTPEQRIEHLRLWQEVRERFKRDMNMNVPEK